MNLSYDFWGPLMSLPDRLCRRHGGAVGLPGSPPPSREEPQDLLDGVLPRDDDRTVGVEGTVGRPRRLDLSQKTVKFHVQQPSSLTPRISSRLCKASIPRLGQAESFSSAWGVPRGSAGAATTARMKAPLSAGKFFDIVGVYAVTIWYMWLLSGRNCREQFHLIQRCNENIT